ncbi:transcription initiation factor TFIID subunit 11 [Geranomyces variabilis]|nr:transcription initiation factor TFIID subunit 11 [Geranomyces variabilis]
MDDRTNTPQPKKRKTAAGSALRPPPPALGAAEPNALPPAPDPSWSVRESPPPLPPPPPPHSSSSPAGILPSATTDPAASADPPKDDDGEEESEVEDELDEYTLPQNAVDRDAEKALFQTFTPEQQARYEAFRRSKIPKPTMKKHLTALCGQSVSDSTAIVVAGVAKLFVGEMTERAREVMQEWGDAGAVQPEHLREAYRRSKTDPTAFPIPGSRKRIFR